MSVLELQAGGKVVGGRMSWCESRSERAASRAADAGHLYNGLMAVFRGTEQLVRQRSAPNSTKHWGAGGLGGDVRI